MPQKSDKKGKGGEEREMELAFAVLDRQGQRTSNEGVSDHDLCTRSTTPSPVLFF